MLFWIFQTSILSILLICLVHYLINFLKTTLTVPKIKDLVNNPNQKYENIYNIIENANSNKYSESNYSESTTDINKLNVNNIDNVNNIETVNNINNDDFLPKQEMKDELKSFLKNQLKEEEDKLKVNGPDNITTNVLNHTTPYSIY
jgi:predicted esterase YcpF (UPF0227 family)